MRESRQFSLIVDLIKSYQGQQPLHRFLQHYFREHKQMGSRDRRLFSDWVYGYYRLGKALSDQPIETKLAVANFLVNEQDGDLLKHAVSEYTNLVPDDFLNTLNDKINIVKANYSSFSIVDIFPFEESMSVDNSGLNKENYFEQFALSIFKQPKVWIRIRSEFEEKIKKEFLENSIAAEQSKTQPNAWSVNQRTKLDSLKSFQSGYFEIQDISSQRTGNYFYPLPNENWYDCCAASGGKSLLLHSIKPSVKLFVSDQRSSVLENLKIRFKRAGIKHYQLFECDLSTAISAELASKKFDGIILDAPCSGSGTWARTPEQISFFQPEKIKQFQVLQRSILRNVFQLLKPGKPLIYITCSVFKEENEVQVEYAKQLGLLAEQQALLQAAEIGGDTMFICRLIKL